MPSEPVNTDIDEAPPGVSEDATADAAQRALKEAMAAAEKSVMEAARTAERIIKESLEALRVQTQTYAGPAGQSVDDAQRYVVERIKERPVTAAFAGLGLGMLIGLLLANRGK